MLVHYFIGAICSASVEPLGLSRILEDAFGPIDLTSPIFPYDASMHYKPEMGEGLGRIFFSLKKCHSPVKLPRFKEDAVQLEQEFFMKKGQRSVNLDPGYLDPVKVVLASTKEGTHKIALTEKIYADMVLEFKNETFHPFDWAPADFKSGKYFPFFLELRQRFLKKL